MRRTRASGGTSSDLGGCAVALLFGGQRWLTDAEHRVSIPYARRLAQHPCGLLA
jgi:hypothetical protein